MRAHSFYPIAVIAMLMLCAVGYAQNKQAINTAVKTDSINLFMTDTSAKNVSTLSKKEKRKLKKIARRNYVLADSLNPYRPNNSVKRVPYSSQPDKPKIPEKPLFGADY